MTIWQHCNAFIVGKHQICLNNNIAVSFSNIWYYVEQWRRFLFSDESHFIVQGFNVSHVRRNDGENISLKHIRLTVKHPFKKIIWGCFSFSEPKSLVPISGMMNGEKYIPIVEKKAIPELNNLASWLSGFWQQELGVEKSIFQQDSATCHTSKLVKAFFLLYA